MIKNCQAELVEALAGANTKIANKIATSGFDKLSLTAQSCIINHCF